METNNKKAIAWVRCSTATQHTTDEQYKAIVAMAEADGYTDIVKIGREGASAIRHGGKMSDEYTADRNQLYTLIESGEYGVLYAWALDRLARDEKEGLWLKWKCRENDVTIKTADGVQVETEANMSADFIYYFKAMIAQDEMKKKAARFKIGKDRNRMQGKWNGGRVRYGYRVNADNFFEVDEAAAAVVRRIYTDFLNGTAARQIAKQLYNEGIINQGTEKGREMFVLKILKDPAYLGRVAGNGTTTYAPLVTKAEQETAIAKLKEGQKQPRRVYEKTVSYALGLLRSPDPAAKAGYYLLSPHRADNQYWTSNGKGCINADLTDSLLLQVCNTYLRNFVEIDQAEILKDWERQTQSYVELIGTATERVDKLKAEIERIERRFIDGKITEATADSLRAPKDAELKRLHDEIADYALRIEQIAEASGNQFDEGAVDLYNVGDEDRRETINKYIDYVNVERVKNGTYSYEIHFKLTDRVERYMIRSKAHEYQHWNGETWEACDIRLLGRYIDRRRSTPAAVKAAA